MDIHPDINEIIFEVPASISPQEAAELYVEAGWMDHANITETEKMLRGTFAVSAAYYQGKLIGFMRALSDGVSDAYLLDLIVTKKCRKLGIGKKILDNLTAYLKQLNIEWILFIGAPDTEAFYEKTSAEKMEKYTPYRMN